MQAAETAVLGHFEQLTCLCWVPVSNPVSCNSQKLDMWAKNSTLYESTCRWLLRGSLMAIRLIEQQIKTHLCWPQQWGCLDAHQKAHQLPQTQGKELLLLYGSCSHPCTQRRSCWSLEHVAHRQRVQRFRLNASRGLWQKLIFVWIKNLHMYGRF